MINGQRIVVVMPAYNAETTLRQTLDEIPDIVDDIVLVDDCSKDSTTQLATELGIPYVIRHTHNRGYGGNQKTCYDKALQIGGDIIVMVHPDYQYTPKLIHSLCYLIANAVYPVAFGSRILGKGALRGGMPMYKYICNRVLTFVQNLMMNQKLSEYHTGYRAFHADVLKSINYNANSDNFVFDNQMIAQIFAKGYEIGEITCPTKYFDNASSINLTSSVKYGLGVLNVSISYLLDRLHIKKYSILH